MSDEEEVLGILVAHGAMAEGLVDAVRRIAGVEPDAILAVSNEGRSPERLEQEIDGLIGDRTAVIFTDLRTGSCALVAQLVCRDRGRRAIVFGVNLPMLLDFVFHRSLPLSELVPRLLRKGRDAIRSVPEPIARADPAVSG